VALETPDFKMFRGMRMPLKKTSSSNDGKINKVIGSKGAIFEFNGSDFSNPVAKPTAADTIIYNGTKAQAFSGVRKGDVKKLSPRFLWR
jgi:hypothetical protein